MPCVAWEAWVLFTMATVLIPDGRETGAGSITLSDIRFVELQDAQARVTQIKSIWFFMILDLRKPVNRALN
jgi:hypothetical protein